MTWPIKKIGDVTKIEGGGTPSTKNPLFWNGDVPWLTPKELSDFSDSEIFDTERKITKEGLSRSSTKLFPAGTVLFTSRAPIGYIVIAGIEMATNQGFKNFICNEKMLDNRFLYYFLKLRTKYLQSLGRGATFTEISKSILAKVDIPIPPLQIQKQIVERFDKIAEAQKLNDGLIKKTDELFQSLLHKELNPSGKNWGVKKLGEVCEKTDQGHPKNFFKKEFRYIDISSINAKAKEIQNTNLIPVDGAPSRARKIVRAGDIVFATTRPYLENIATVPFEFNSAIASTGFCVIRANTKIAQPEFLYFTVISRSFIKKVLPFQRGANYPAVSDKDVFGIKISLPPLQLQKQIVAKLSAVQDYKKQLLEHNLKLKELFDSVLAKSMAGKM